MTPNLSRRDRFALNRMMAMILGAMVVGGGLIHCATEAGTVPDHAEQLAPQRVTLSEVAVDPFYSTPTPAPNDLIHRDSLKRIRVLYAGCVARLSETPAYPRWKQVAGVEK